MNKMIKKPLSKLFLIGLVAGLSSCSNKMDIVETGHPMGVFEPKNDYVVDIPMKSQVVTGQSQGVKILGLDWLTFGAEYRAQGIGLGSRGAGLNSGGGGGGGASTVETIVNVGSGLVAAAIGPLTGSSTTKKFKEAALRSACDQNNCDVVGYPMWTVDTKNYILWKTYKVNVKGFPGKVQSLEVVPRIYDPRKDTYWRNSTTSGRNPLSSIDAKKENERVARLNSIESRADELLQRIKELEANQTLPANYLTNSDNR